MDIVDRVLRPDEREPLRTLQEAMPKASGRVAFSAKESVYKAWFPLIGRWLNFSDVRLSFDLDRRAFRADRLVPWPVGAGEPLRSVEGRWGVTTEFGFTLVAVVTGR